MQKVHPSKSKNTNSRRNISPTGLNPRCGGDPYHLRTVAPRADPCAPTNQKIVGVAPCADPCAPTDKKIVGVAPRADPCAPTNQKIVGVAPCADPCAPTDKK